MARKPDKMHEMSDRLAEWVNGRELAPFWNADGHPRLDYELLAEMLSVPLSQGEGSQTGRLASSVDLWLSWEFQRAGFAGVWPRMTEPRVVDPEVIRSINALPASARDVGERLVTYSGSADANVMGSMYVKQVDVGISSWLVGPELLVSTKTMSGAFSKNLANRFEEAYGDVKNLRGRYPRAAHGFLFLVRSTIVDEPSALDKAQHMLRQLVSGGDVYDAVGMLLADWEDAGSRDSIKVPAVAQDRIADVLSVPRFFETLIDHMLREAPMDCHALARKLRTAAS